LKIYGRRFSSTVSSVSSSSSSDILGQTEAEPDDEEELAHRLAKLALKISASMVTA